MDGLDSLGAVDGLAAQFITLRVKHIDRDKLRQKLGGSTGSMASSAVTMVDAAPKAALDAALPVAVAKARDYGIDLETMVTNAPPSPKGRALSEFWPGLAVGIGIGGASLAIVKLVGKLIGGRAAV